MERRALGDHTCADASPAFCAGLQSPSFSMGLQQGGRVCVRALHGDGERSATALQQNRREKHEISEHTRKYGWTDIRERGVLESTCI